MRNVICGCDDNASPHFDLLLVSMTYNLKLMLCIVDMNEYYLKRDSYINLSKRLDAVFGL